MRPAAVAMVAVLPFVLAVPSAIAQVALKGKIVYTMNGPPVSDGVVIIQDGKVAAVGPAASTPVPPGMKVLDGAVVTPGLIDAHSVVGLSGMLNQKQDQDQLEHSAPIQPELRAIDAYNPRDPLVAWVRSLGITTLHTGHAPGELIAGQSAIVKTAGNTVEEAVLVETASVAATIGLAARKGEGKSPGTRGKMLALLRAELIKAQEYDKKRAGAADDKKPERSLRSDVMVRVLKGELLLMVTVHRAQDIESALRLAQEFNIRLLLDGAAESFLLIDRIKAAGVPVIIHPSMQRAVGEAENQSFETAAALVKAGIPVAMQSGFESYVPKTRVVLLEAAITAANGLTFEQALATVTIDAARILGVADRVGSLVVGKDGDAAVYDGDPFEYTTHCVGVVINGKVVSEVKR